MQLRNVSPDDVDAYVLCEPGGAVRRRVAVAEEEGIPLAFQSTGVLTPCVECVDGPFAALPALAGSEYLAERGYQRRSVGQQLRVIQEWDACCDRRFAHMPVDVVDEGERG